MSVKQLSVFLENKAGRVDEILQLLSEKNVDIVAMSLADTTEYGMLRMIVSNPDMGREILKANSITAKLVNVVALKVPHETGSLYKAMKALVAGGINIEYMYAFANGSEASAILKTKTPDEAEKIIKEAGFGTWEAGDAYQMNIK